MAPRAALAAYQSNPNPSQSLTHKSPYEGGQRRTCAVPTFVCALEKVGTLSLCPPYDIDDAVLSARRNRLVAAVIVKTALRLAPAPAGFDVFHQERARPVLRARQAPAQHLHDGKARIEHHE